MGMVWTPIATAMLMASSVATFLTMCHLRCRWDVHASSVRWLFWLFFLYVWVWCVLRAAYFLWMSLLPRKAFVDVDAPAYSSSGSQEDDPVGWTYEQFDRLGIHAILHLKDAKKPSITTLLIAGDVALFGIAICIFPLTYELWRLAKYSMDRGVKKEQKMIKSYAIGLHSAILVFASMQTSLAVVYNGYNVYTHRAVLCVYLIQFLSLGFMAVLLCMLKVNGRKYETIHGTFVASPVYQRLKRIMLVYAVFSFQYQLSTIIIYFHDNAGANGVVSGVGVSLIIYNASGLALSITTSCSQACVFSACAPCLPEDFEAEYLHRRFDGQSEAPAEEDLEAPTENPVFVYTDIESSSALWAVEDGEVMDKATEIHDDILRTTLPKHRGYEITTVGDAFQVAFHTIRDAVEYCMDVQLQLLVAKWPKELHGMVPATEKVRAGRKLIFNGLRVRMGIHDAAESEGTLVQDVHAVTGKTTYTGVSEIIAEYIGDLGCGGQILVTGRVATWLKHHCSDLTVDVFVERVGVYTVPQMNANVEVFQLLPAMLAGRARFFTPPEKGRKRQETRDSSRRADASRRLRRMASQNVNLHTVHAAQVSPKPRIFAFLETAQDANRAKSFRL